MSSPFRLRLLLAASMLLGLAAPRPADAEENTPTLWERPQLLGEAGGLRPALEKLGVTVSLQQTNEVWSSPSGGLRRGAALGSMTQLGMVLDTDKAGLWPGGTLTVSGLAIGGRFPGADLVGNLQSPTNIEARRGFYLYEAWYEQALPAGLGSLRLGQIRADAEFLTSGYSDSTDYANAGALFLNSSFGFPVLTALALPSGGPAYPLATPGARLKLTPTDSVTLLLGAFNGTPAASAFTFRGRVLWMAEAQWAVNQGDDAPGRAGTYRLGAWHHTERFVDQRRDAAGLSLADPLSSGNARRLPGNTGFYVMADQVLLQTGETKAQAIGVFGRVMLAPGDRNPVDLYINGGLTWKGPISARPDDALGIGIAWAQIGRSARGLDRDAAAFGAAGPLRSSEMAIEATYQIAVAGWWQVQPDLQYIIRPGGGVADPRRPGRTLRDALVIGLRSTITF